MSRLVIIILLTAIIVFPAPASGLVWRNSEADHKVGRTTRIINLNGKLVTMTARKVNLGDVIITASGSRYRVIFTGGEQAKAVQLSKDNKLLAWVEFFEDTPEIPVAAANWRNRPVGIYHTHTDESYLPTDGKSSIPFRGGIYQVGSRFAAALRENDVKALYYKTPHDPHDDNSYARSRRTAMGLLKNNPVALFDIHRDGIPEANFFAKEIKGNEIAQLRIVVGRQNPKAKANLDFARRLLAHANKEYPGLVKEIYLADGNYNQDLLSTSLLLEAGTYTNSKGRAEKGVAFLADSVPVILGFDKPGAGITGDKAGRTGWQVSFWLVSISLAAGTVFMVINYGWAGTVEKIRSVIRSITSGEMGAKIYQAGARAKDYIRGPVTTRLQSAWSRVRERAKRNRL